uniref:Uncharacterized protein n=1 Tax=Anguilla anguilla TaxID=7936 RepID=A0A0E9P8U3_ANGAN
MRCRHLAKM